MDLTLKVIEGSRQDLFIAGERVAPRSGRYMPSYDPTNAAPWYEVADAGADDVDAAVQAAKRAFHDPAWRRLTQTDRGKLLRRLADLIAEHADELAAIETRDNGKLLKEMRVQLRAAPDSYLYFAGMADKLHGETIPVNKLDMLNFTLREPIGVVGMISPWNSPLMLLTGTLAPCLAIGNTVVVKPSEHTSASTLALAELIAKAGFPAGVFNVITGKGATAGEALTLHPDVAKIAFTGSTATGRRIAANRLVSCQMELGGKSPHVVFADTDIERAVNGVVAGVFAAAGQTCIAGSRCFVEKSIYAAFVEKLADRTRRVRIGHPTDEDTEIGPLALAAQLDKVEQYVDYGVADGARLVAGGHRPRRDDLPGGWYYEPTVLADARNDMRFMRDEIFGPVVGVVSFDNESELIGLANDTHYGLAAGVWTRDIDRALRFARNVDAGTVWVNTYRSAAYMSPSGGFKESGYGKRGGFEVMREFSRLKNVVIDYSGATQDPFVIRLC
ncbi:aldehyde dehydrogenase [Mesorhizobium sp. B2-5-3]|uniref:aldehyde dehydrogenase n=1 Tax=Mesorhizobium sp. B2-5-3 TaxID=2589927 RepID=UPI00112A6787|nr:aldehyde dehydrogenase [Mesorhizobium sp. B2-5-3]TPK30738.1 aldehyde dehydrogenase [Mesorhizobium sp. B2-5-3]